MLPQQLFHWELYADKWGKTVAPDEEFVWPLVQVQLFFHLYFGIQSREHEPEYIQFIFINLFYLKLLFMI